MIDRINAIRQTESVTERAVEIRIIQVRNSEECLESFSRGSLFAELEPIILATAARAAKSTLDDLGSAAILSDIAAMRHETLGARLFIS